MNIIAELDAFDGKHTDILEALAKRLQTNEAQIENLCVIARSDESKLQVAATWILKWLQENGLSFSEAQIENILTLFSQVTYWEAKLHLLQMIPGFVIPTHSRYPLYHILMGYLNEDNKFVRAWSYNGLAQLAEQYPDHRAEVAKLLETGQHEEAASVKARIRNIRKVASWAS